MKEHDQIAAIIKLTNWQPIQQDFDYVKAYRELFGYEIGIEVCWPRYTTDLNEMHKAERIAFVPSSLDDPDFDLKWTRHDLYVEILEGMVGRGDVAFVTAAEKAKAFLKVFTKWEETK